jgi:hypothetical protein
LEISAACHPEEIMAGLLHDKELEMSICKSRKTSVRHFFRYMSF